MSEAEQDAALHRLDVGSRRTSRSTGPLARIRSPWPVNVGVRRTGTVTMPNPTIPTDEVPVLVRALYDIVHRLEELFPGRRFTLDGHLVGSIGEVIAAHRYGLTLRRSSFTGCDATAPDGRAVEVKATQGDRVALRCQPNHLLVLHLDAKGGVAEVYNGPGDLVWPHVGRQQSNGQSTVSVTRLRALMASVAPSARLPLVSP